WETWVFSGRITAPSISGRTNNDSPAVIPIPVPLFFRQSIGDHWTLYWTAGLPLSIQHQLHHGPSFASGLSLSTSIGYGSAQGFLLSPTLSSWNRYKLGQGVALQGQLILSSHFQSSNNYTPAGGTGVSAVGSV